MIYVSEPKNSKMKQSEILHKNLLKLAHQLQEHTLSPQDAKNQLMKLAKAVNANGASPTGRPVQASVPQDLVSAVFDDIRAYEEYWQGKLLRMGLRQSKVRPIEWDTYNERLTRLKNDVSNKIEQLKNTISKMELAPHEDEGRIFGWPRNYLHDTYKAKINNVEFCLNNLDINKKPLVTWGFPIITYGAKILNVNLTNEKELIDHITYYARNLETTLESIDEWVTKGEMNVYIERYGMSKWTTHKL